MIEYDYINLANSQFTMIKFLNDLDTEINSDVRNKRNDIRIRMSSTTKPKTKDKLSPWADPSQSEKEKLNRFERISKGQVGF